MVVFLESFAYKQWLSSDSLLSEIILILDSMLMWKIFCAMSLPVWSGKWIPCWVIPWHFLLISLFSGSFVKDSFFIILYQLHVLLVVLARTHGVTEEDFLWEFYIHGWGCTKGRLVRDHCDSGPQASRWHAYNDFLRSQNLSQLDPWLLKI